MKFCTYFILIISISSSLLAAEFRDSEVETYIDTETGFLLAGRDTSTGVYL